jgi:hypothetical protein
VRRTAKILFLGPLIKSSTGWGFHYLQAGVAPLLLEYKTRQEATKTRLAMVAHDVFAVTDQQLFKAFVVSLEEERMLEAQKHVVKLNAQDGIA